MFAATVGIAAVLVTDPEVLQDRSFRYGVLGAYFAYHLVRSRVRRSATPGPPAADVTGDAGAR